MEAILVLCNCPPAHATTLAKQLVEARLAACVGVSAPIQSVYRWEGAMQSETEVTLQIKTISSRLAALETFILQNHPYDVPEIIAQPIVHAAPDYLNWLISEVTGGLVHWVETAASTQDTLKSMVKEAARHGTTVITTNQSAGRGRRTENGTRSWACDPGSGLAMSIYLAGSVPAANAASFSLAAGVEVAEALRARGVPVTLKWPNDLLLDGGKLGGVLIEGELSEGKLSGTYVGVGLNMLPSRTWPRDAKPRPISLADAGYTLSPGVLAEITRTAVLTAWDHFVEAHLGPYLTRWEALCAWKGETITTSTGTSGRVLGINTSGALRLATAEGESLVTTGEVHGPQG